MFRIRLHGRGGQGIKTGARILGSAFFAQGFEAQDAPLYGAERRGAPIYATVRAARARIFERGPVLRPDLVVVADETLLAVAAAGILAGISPKTVLLLRSAEPADTWSHRLQLRGPLLALPADADGPGPARFLGATSAGAAARLVGVLSRDALEQALGEELRDLSGSDRQESIRRALAAFERMAPHAGCVREGAPVSAGTLAPPDWIDVPSEHGPASEPAILVPATSVQVRTGLWRTMRPEIDAELCHRCSWICSTFCPDGAILVDAERRPSIDYDHCKGCLVCVAVCPPHAIRAVSEAEARAAEGGARAPTPPEAPR